MSIKERVEQQIIQELLLDPFLRPLCPTRQNSDEPRKMPHIAVAASPQQEYQVGARIYRVGVELQIRFSAKREGQTPLVLDQIVERCRTKLEQAQARGDYGVIMEGETNRFEGETTRMRVINATVISN